MIHSSLPPALLRRPAHTSLDQATIHVGDIVHLQPADGPAIRARVIYNAPLNGVTTYTTDLVRCPSAGAARPTRLRFRHEHVHRIEPLSRRAA